MSSVRVYTSGFCGYCWAAKALLKKEGIPFEEVSVDGDPAARRALAQRAGRTSVPQIWIGETHVGGSDELHALHRRGTLEPLLAAEGIRR